MKLGTVLGLTGVSGDSITSSSVLFDGADDYFRSDEIPGARMPADSKLITVLALVYPTTLKIAQIVEFTYSLTLDLTTTNYPVLEFFTIGTGAMRIQGYGGNPVAECFRGTSSTGLVQEGEWNVVGASIDPASGLCKFIRWSESTGLDVESVTPSVNTNEALALDFVQNIAIGARHNLPSTPNREWDGYIRQVFANRSYNDFALSAVQDKIIDADEIFNWETTFGSGMIHHLGGLSDFLVNNGSYTNASGNTVYDDTVAYGDLTGSTEQPTPPFTL